MNTIRKRYGAFLFSFISVSLIWGIYYSYNNKVMRRGLHVMELTPGVKSYIHEITKRQTPLETTPSSEQARVLCLILTVEDTLQTRAAVVNATWARRCNRYFYVLNTNEVSSDIINTPFEETRNNIIHKVKYSLTYIYEHHIDDFDWILKADDDTYIIMENLQFLLRKQDSKKPHYLGFHFNKFVRNGYMSGGAGYVISNCGLRYLVEFGFYRERCPVVQNEEDPENSEDIEIGRCLSIAKVPIINSIDEEGRETFHPYPLEKHLMGSIPEYVFDWAKHQHKEGMDCCSKYSISFHYMEPKMMLLMDHLLYRTSVYGLRNCGQEAYFGPLGKCQDCGTLCDKPSQYPKSCEIYCPDYIPKERPTTTQYPSTSVNVKSLIIGGFSILGTFVFLIFILTLLWKKFLRRRYYRAVEERRRRKQRIPIRTPVQVRPDEEANPELNNIFESTDDSDTDSAESSVEQFENDVNLSLDDVEVNGVLVGETVRSDSAVIRIYDETSNDSRSDAFDFGQTFPFHSLSSLEGI